MRLRVFILFLLLTELTLTSCRTEETEFIQAPEEETLVANSSIALLMQRTTSNDGSKNNIIDNANCFDIAFPYEVIANGEWLIINSKDDYGRVECLFDSSEDNTDLLSIEFPINIIAPDYSEITVANLAELNGYIADCNGENIADADIECIDFMYPIHSSTFNTTSELLETVSLNTDNDLFSFINNIDPNTIITLEFPILVKLADNSEISVNNFDALEIAILNAENTCDEDDDYDYNDDDCNACSRNEIEDLLTSCSDWTVNTLRRNNNTNYDNIYYDYAFNFFMDGTLSVAWNSTVVFGTFITSGTGNNIEIIIDIPSLPLCNNNWKLQEIQNCSVVTEIDLRVGLDRIRYEKNCN